MSTPTKTKSPQYFEKFQNNDGNHFEILKNSINDFNKLNCCGVIIDVFKNYHQMFKRNKSIDSGIEKNSCLFNAYYEKPSDDYIMCDKNTFYEKFNSLTNNILHFFNWDNIVVAGGVINLAIMPGKLPEKIHDMDYDIDFFLYGVNESKAIKIVSNIYESIKDIIPECYIIKTSKTITIMLPKPYHNIQFVTTLFNDKEDILHNFDLQSSKVLFDGETVWTTIDGHFSYHHKTNIYMKNYVECHSYESRLKKYSLENRGFRVFIPQFNKNMISNYVYKMDIKDETTNPIVKLIVMENNNVVTHIGDGYSQQQNSNMSGYNTTFFKRSKTLKQSFDILKTATQNILNNIKIRDENDSVTNKNKYFKIHNLKTHPIYIKFDNIKKALIHSTGYDPELDESFFINGPTFSKSIIYDAVNNTQSETNKDKITLYMCKNNLTKEYNYDDVYFTEENAENIKNIMLGNKVTIPQLTGRDNYGNTYMQAAIITNNIDIVNELIKNNYNIHEKLNDGSTPVHLSIRKHRNDITQIFIDHMKKNGITSVKKYDDNRCNLIHYTVMYDNIQMFNILRDNFNVPLSDISWSVQFYGHDRNMHQRHSKYICCAKFCIMYKQYDILKLLLDEYDGYDNFKYLFVDSDSVSSKTDDILNYCIKQCDVNALNILLPFFKKHRITATFNVYNLTSRSFNDDIMNMMFVINKHTIHQNNYVASNIVTFLHDMYSKHKFLDVFNYINKYVPTIWTEDKFSKIHDKIEFKNVFGNKYVDTQKGLHTFAIIKCNNITEMKKSLPEIIKTLYYGLYIYDTNKNTVLSLCKDDIERLHIILDNLTEKLSNKTGTYTENIFNLLRVNHSVLYNLNATVALLENKTHGKNVLEYITTYAEQIMSHIFSICFGHTRCDLTEINTTYITQFVKYIELLKKYNVLVDYCGSRATVRHTGKKLNFKIPLSYIPTYKQIINSIMTESSNNITFSLETYIKDVKNEEDLKILIEHCTCIDKEYTIDDYIFKIKNTKIVPHVISLFFDKTDDILLKSLSWPPIYKQALSKYVITHNLSSKIFNKNIIFNDILIKLNNTNKDTINNSVEFLLTLINIAYEDDVKNIQLIDNDGNTIFHSLAAYHMYFIQKMIHIFSKETHLINLKNKDGITILDYAERSINDTTQYPVSELSKNYDIFNKLKNILLKNYTYDSKSICDEQTFNIKNKIVAPTQKTNIITHDSESESEEEEEKPKVALKKQRNYDNDSEDEEEY